ncbi:MAG TPA: ABC transporter substrate-binding protein [Solirubrobacteraceae bacterium]|nr:ABC transporter substrate-binding protein [Solirubrobacteraceae bacterium]
MIRSLTRSPRRLLAAAGAATAALALAACGAKHDQLSPGRTPPQQLTLMLDWFPNADHVGLYTAMADGYFRQAGIALHVEVPGDVATPLQLVAAGRVDAAISYEPELLLARDRGEPLAAIAAIVQRPLTSIISIGPHRVTSPAQLRGKRVGDAGIAYQHAYLDTILRHAGVPVSSVREVNVGANLVPAMLSGRVDATLGGYWNYEAIELRQDGRHPYVIPVQDAGVPTYDELVIVVREDEIARDNNLLRRFVQALGRGYEAVRADPSAGVDALLAADPSLSRRLQTASVHATLPAFFPAAGHPWGWMDPSQWNAYGEWMLRNHLITHPAAIAYAETDQLLAGQGP